MQFTITALFVAAVVAAMPQEPDFIARHALGAMTLKQASSICKSDQEVHCCDNKKSATSGDHTEGDWGAHETDGSNLHGGHKLGVFDQCSPINVNKGTGDGLLKTECKGKVACCNKSINVQGGFINHGAPECVVYGKIA